MNKNNKTKKESQILNLLKGNQAKSAEIDELKDLLSQYPGYLHQARRTNSDNFAKRIV